jgi:hypothetical protein
MSEMKDTEIARSCGDKLTPEEQAALGLGWIALLTFAYDFEERKMEKRYRHFDNAAASLRGLLARYGLERICIRPLPPANGAKKPKEGEVMGYPMTYKRVVNRNNLAGDYHTENGATPMQSLVGLVSGDLRRLEQDSRDGQYGKQIADAAGVSPEVAAAVLTAFFTDCGRHTIAAVKEVGNEHF